VPFYRRDDAGRYLPTDLASGPPWVPGSQHGSAVTALLARAVELAPAPTPMRLVRLTVDLSRAVPYGPTDVRLETVRSGRRVQVLEAEMVVAGEVRARASALRLRVDDAVLLVGEAPAPWPDDAAPVGPGDARATSPVGHDALWEAHDARWQDGTAGAGCVWLRPRHPLVEGEELSPTLRAAMVADLAMSGGGLLPAGGFAVVNADLTLALVRPPAGDWLAVRSRVRLHTDGTGQTEAALSDGMGCFGRVLKSLLVERR
jgi:hypothetical protein